MVCYHQRHSVAVKCGKLMGIEHFHEHFCSVYVLGSISHSFYDGWLLLPVGGSYDDDDNYSKFCYTSVVLISIPIQRLDYDR